MQIKQGCVDSRLGSLCYCPICDVEQLMYRVYEKQFITFLNIPVVSIRKIQTGVECPNCQMQFSLRELVEQSVKKPERGQTPVVFAGSCLRCVLHLLGSDHDLNDNVVAVLRSGFETHSTGDSIELEDIYAMRQSIIRDETNIGVYVQQLVTILTPEQRVELSQHVTHSVECYENPELTSLAIQIAEILQ